MKIYEVKNGIRIEGQEDLKNNQVSFLISHPDKIKLLRLSEVIFNLVKNLSESEVTIL